MKSPILFITALLVIGCHADRRGEVTGDAHDDCRTGDLDACYEHGVSREVGTVEERRSALVAYQYACLLDHGPSCGRLAQIFGGEGVTPGRAMENLRKGCDAGDNEACVELGSLLPDRSSLPIYQRSCEAGSAAACEKTAAILRKRFRVGDNLVRAQELSVRSCEAGHAPGCISAGQALLFGSGVEQNAAQGLAYLERSCTEDSGDGCMILARVWQDGLGVEPDRQRADDYYAMAERHVSEPVARNAASAFVVYVNACNYGDLLGCFNAAWFLAEGAEVRRNISTSRELFERACSGDVAESCERWRKIQPRQRVERRRVR